MPLACKGVLRQGSWVQASLNQTPVLLAYRLLETVPNVCSSNSINDSTTESKTSRTYKVGKADAVIELARRAVATADYPGRAPCLARLPAGRQADHRTPQPPRPIASPFVLLLVRILFSCEDFHAGIFVSCCRVAL